MENFKKPTLSQILTTLSSNRKLIINIPECTGFIEASKNDLFNILKDSILNREVDKVEIEDNDFRYVISITKENKND